MFNTENVKSMRSMFENCKLLKYLNILNFKIQELSVANSMFSGFMSLEDLILSDDKILKANCMWHENVVNLIKNEYQKKNSFR